MTEKNTETSPSGNPIYRYEASNKDFEPAYEMPHIEELEQHIEKYFGNVETVYHELASHLVHMDVHFVKPTKERNYNILITSGMSYRPMQAPKGAEDYKFAELLICLPPDWPLDQDDLEDKKNYWPIRQLKFLARFPHEYDTWLWWGHTIPNGDPPQPFTDNTKLSGIILAPPVLFPEEAFTLDIDANKTIYFFSLVPLYTEEMDFKLKKGSEALFSRFDKHGINELLDIKRANVGKKSLWPF